ncbi:MAG TPA: decarboxylase [Candidatus Eisenbacteria bacterium]|uniref:Decarboxylase n=1 Tax=Eiseniibacteriota bacterium TaxID=2212470 RepID=A0A7V2AW90_UNCEI|nr:decarboxylase [Candidatus Eisenbacteria bacterium]
MALEKDMLERARNLLRQEIPLINQGRMESFVGSCITRAGTFLDLISENGSPLYIVDRGGLARDLARMRTAFSALPGDVEIFYAMKSNNMPEIAGIMAGEGAGLDVSSGLELKTAVEAGARSMIFSGPGKTDDELALTMYHADRVTLMIDSFGELERLDRLTRAKGITVRAGVRLTVRPDGLWRKFGIPVADLARFAAKADSCPFVQLEGLQFHTSWNLNPTAHVSFISELGRALKALPALLLRDIEFIDLGGGFWPEQGEWLRAAGTAPGMLRNLLKPEKPDTTSKYRLRSTDIETFAAAIGDELRRSIPSEVECRFFIEPGRWLCHQNMHILLTVVDVKAPDIVITDAGTNAVGWERFEHDYFPVINLSDPDISERRCGVFGSLCTPHDVWGWSYFGGGIERGDVLLVPLQGAYTYSLRQQFIKPLPKTAIVQGPLDLRWKE